jgi:hypothetical protein
VRRLTTPPCKTIIVTKPPKKEGRPRPTPGCSAEEEEEERRTWKLAFTMIMRSYITKRKKGKKKEEKFEL